MPPKPCTICLKPHYGEDKICIVCRTKEQEILKGAADAMGDWMSGDKELTDFCMSSAEPSLEKEWKSDDIVDPWEEGND